MKKRLLALALSIACAFAGFVRAEPLTRTLGQGLTLYRVHQLPADLPTAEDARRQACVLDLRYVDGGSEEAASLAAWLKFHATAHAPVFVLANAATGRALRQVILPRGAGASVVVIGAAADEFTPDVAVKTTAETERRAYDALEHGTLADALLTENTDKPRNDEAKLAKDRAPEPAPIADEPPPAESSTKPASAIADAVAKPPPPAPTIDAALQRAVQLHRTLLALKKI